jgi:putative iron-regulated protein
MRITLRALVLLGCVLPVACTTSPGDEGGATQPLTADEVAPVAENYAAMVYANYAEARASADLLRTRLDQLVSSPSLETLLAARNAWLVAREPYGETEVYRFYDGPIDNPTDGPEGQLNAWPMDEAYVDYVEGAPDSGIINDPTTYPTIDAALLSSLNEAGGETNIATGYHAIEFLLWGQDLAEDGAGARPFTDYDTSGAGTAANQDRRGVYLSAVAELLLSDLDAMVVAWDPASSGNYRTEFLAEEPDEIVRRMLLGMGSLSGAELAGERMSVALDTQDQEDEHSCFSDNTHRDIINNATAIQNVYEGRYGMIDGPGTYDLVAARDQALADRLRDELQTSLQLAIAIPSPSTGRSSSSAKPSRTRSPPCSSRPRPSCKLRRCSTSRWRWSDDAQARLPGARRPAGAGRLQRGSSARARAG